MYLNIALNIVKKAKQYSYLLNNIVSYIKSIVDWYIVVFTINTIIRKVKIMKVIIFSVSAGGGHGHAAEAIKSYILENEPDSEVEIIDIVSAVEKAKTQAIHEEVVLDKSHE